MSCAGVRAVRRRRLAAGAAGLRCRAPAACRCSPRWTAARGRPWQRPTSRTPGAVEAPRRAACTRTSTAVAARGAASSRKPARDTGAVDARGVEHAFESADVRQAGAARKAPGMLVRSRTGCCDRRPDEASCCARPETRCRRVGPRTACPARAPRENRTEPDAARGCSSQTGRGHAGSPPGRGGRRSSGLVAELTIIDEALLRRMPAH